MEAMWDCVSQLWVPGRSCVYERPYLSVLPHNSATLQFQLLMSMQMDAEFKQEQIGNPSYLGGGTGRGVWGVGGGSGGSSPKIGRAFLQNFIPASWRAAENLPEP